MNTKTIQIIHSLIALVLFIAIFLPFTTDLYKALGSAGTYAWVITCFVGLVSLSKTD